MKTQVLTFVNHASFYVTNAETLLLVDPWVEGPACNNGWSLLDSSTSNAGLVKEIASQHRNTFVWFSQEQSDHFSLSFVRRLKQDFPRKLTLLFQRTRDKRVVTYLRRSGFTVIECLPGLPVCLDNDMAITVHPHTDGHSYAMITCGGRNILNLNDCAIDTAALCRDVKRKLGPLGQHTDILMTQFGYGTWVGNPFEAEARRRAAELKLQRIKLQIAAFAPTLTIPFASFAHFASIENNYLNDGQNGVGAVARWSARAHATGSIRFMQPGGKIDLDHDTPATTVRRSDMAITHWEKLARQPLELLPPEPSATVQQVRAALDQHRARVRASLLVLPHLLELIGLIQPLRIYVPDLDRVMTVSYLRGYAELPAGTPYDISLTSPSAVFLFSNEYGFKTTHANGRFRTSDPGALERFSRFFLPQNLARQGYGVQHPIATLRYLGGNVLSRLQRTLAAMQRRLITSRAR